MTQIIVPIVLVSLMAYIIYLLWKMNREKHDTAEKSKKEEFNNFT
jgi:hypothetical protein